MRVLLISSVIFHRSGAGADDGLAWFSRGFGKRRAYPPCRLVDPVWLATCLLGLPFALVILALFLLFVPKEELLVRMEVKAEENAPKVKLDKTMWMMGIYLAFLAFFVINVNTFLTIRIPQIILAKGIGTAQQASLILSLMQVMGIVAGTVFSSLVGRLKGWLLAVSYVVLDLRLSALPLRIISGCWDSVAWCQDFSTASF